jgi:hypothetical protein
MRRCLYMVLAVVVASTPSAANEAECRRALDELLPSLGAIFRTVVDVGKGGNAKLSSCPTDLVRLEEDAASMMKLAEATATVERRARSLCGDGPALREARAMAGQFSRLVKEYVDRCKARK